MGYLKKRLKRPLVIVVNSLLKKNSGLWWTPCTAGIKSIGKVQITKINLEAHQLQLLVLTTSKEWPLLLSAWEFGCNIWQYFPGLTWFGWQLLVLVPNGLRWRQGVVAGLLHVKDPRVWSRGWTLKRNSVALYLWSLGSICWIPMAQENIYRNKHENHCHTL
jgi:hypothetical protein